VTVETGFAKLLGASVQGQALRRLVRYGELLEQWSGVHNLVRFQSRRELVERHLLESRAACGFLAGSGRLADVGSGAGLPGVPILASCPGWEGVLLEPRVKRWAFLSRVVAELRLRARVDRSRFEAFSDGGFDLVTVRALADHRGVCEWARGRLNPGGCVALWTTDGGEEALRSLGGWRVLSSALCALETGRLIRLYPV